MYNPIVKNAIHTTIIPPINGAIYLNHLDHGILANASAPIKTPDVGVIKLIIPVPNWYAVIINWLDTPTKSESGDNTGIVSDASPEDDGIKNANTDSIAKDKLININLGNLLSKSAE